MRKRMDRQLAGNLRAVPELLAYLARPGARHRNDLSAARDHNAASLGPRLPPGLALQWLGTAGFLFTYERYTLLVDPYLSRGSAARVFANAPLRADEAVLRRHVPHADAVLVGHTHFDHALDVAALCRMHGCPAYGGSSLAAILRLHGAADLARVVEPQRVLSLGPFEVTFVPSRHSKLLLGLAVPLAGEFTCDHLDRLRGWHFRCGDVYGIHIAVAGRSFYHLGSADLCEDQVRQRGVDVLLACIAGRGFTPGFVARAVRALSPEVIVAHHHDNFFLPIEGPMGFSFNVNFGGFVDEVRAVSRELELRAFAPLQVIQSSPGKPRAAASSGPV